MEISMKSHFRSRRLQDRTGRRTSGAALAVITAIVVTFPISRLGGTCQAAIVSGSIAGEWTTVSNVPGVSVGDPFLIDFTYDTAVVDSNPSPSVGLFVGALSWDATSGVFSFSSSVPVDLLLVDNADTLTAPGFPRDPDLSSLTGATGDPDIIAISINFLLIDPTMTVFNADAPLPEQFNGDLFSLGDVQIRGWNQMTGGVAVWELAGDVTSVVPEVGSMAMMATALAALVSVGGLRRCARLVTK